MKAEDSIKLKLLYGQQLTPREQSYVKNHSGSLHKRIAQYRFSEYENWGINHSQDKRLFAGCLVPELRPVIEEQMNQSNWFFVADPLFDREQFFQRLFSLRYEILLDKVDKFIKVSFGAFPIAGLAFFGGALYGKTDKPADDIDLMVFLQGAPFTANPVSMHLPNMKRELFLPDAPRKVKTGKVGLTIIGTEAVHPKSQEENVKGFSLTYWGQCVSVFGSAFCSEAPPAAANIPFPYRTMAWGYKDILMNQSDCRSIIRSLTRVMFGITILNFVVKNLGLGGSSSLSQAQIWETIKYNASPKQLANLYIASSHKLAAELSALECVIKAQALKKIEEI